LPGYQFRFDAELLARPDRSTGEAGTRLKEELDEAFAAKPAMRWCWSAHCRRRGGFTGFILLLSG
jgi:hypothetical protein